MIKTARYYWRTLVSSKTLIFNMLLAMVGAIEVYSGVLQGFFSDPKYFGMFMVAISMFGAALRFVTTTSISTKLNDRFGEDQ